MSGPENDLSSTLARQAEQFGRRGGADLDLAQVVSRAGEIRRGRRMRATMVMAAVVLAVAVPVGVTVIGNDPTKTAPGPAEPPTANTSPITLGDLETGDAPGTGYLRDNTLFGAGDPIELDAGSSPAYLARMDGGFLVGRSDPDTQQLVAAFVADDPADEIGQTWAIDSGFAVSADGSLGALVQTDGTVVVVEKGGYFELGRITAGTGTPLGVTGDCVAPSTCTVYVQTYGDVPQTWEVSSDDSVTGTDTGLAAASDVRLGDERPHRFAGILAFNDDMSTCSAVSVGEPLWTTCPGTESGKRLQTFSPDGEHLLATGSVGSGEGDAELAILDAANGDVLLDLSTVEQAVIRQVVWEDDTHVLALVRDGERFAVIRFGLDGSREYALAPAPGIDFDTAPFSLPLG